MRDRDGGGERDANLARARGRLRRSALIWGPLCAAAVLGALWLLIEEYAGIRGEGPLEPRFPSLAEIYENAGLFVPGNAPLPAGEGSGLPWLFPAILLALALLFAYQASLAIRDLRGNTETQTGFITRRWRRLDLASRSHYLRIDNDKIIRIERVQFLTVDKDDYVEVEYFPASMAAVTVEKREAPEGASPPEDERGKPPPPVSEPDPLLIERD